LAVSAFPCSNLYCRKGPPVWPSSSSTDRIHSIRAKSLRAISPKSSLVGQGSRVHRLSPSAFRATAVLGPRLEHAQGRCCRRRKKVRSFAAVSRQGGSAVTDERRFLATATSAQDVRQGLDVRCAVSRTRPDTRLVLLIRLAILLTLP
jgi:hypothetical protein